MKKMLKQGFTLIELLVVITIIGILATGAVTVYTGQMTKARDSVRTTDMKAIQGALEQSFLDIAVYPLPATFVTDLAAFLPNLPNDPRTTTARAGTALEYFYNVGPDAATVAQQEYEVSMGVERAIPLLTTDGGNDALRIEMGVDVGDTVNHLTTRSGAVPVAITAGQCVNATTGSGSVTCAAGTPMVIR